MYIIFVLICPNPTDTCYQGAVVIGIGFFSCCFVKVFCLFFLSELIGFILWQCYCVVTQQGTCCHVYCRVVTIL